MVLDYGHQVKDAFKILGYGSAKKIESKIFGITRKLKKIAQRTRKDRGQLKACGSTLTERMFVSLSYKNLISCDNIQQYIRL
jgi:hypothetical protein